MVESSSTSCTLGNETDPEIEYFRQEAIALLRERYGCPHFRILVIGRASAGKTTILEKVCGVSKGTRPVIYDKNGTQISCSQMHLMPSIERGIHDIEHQITYYGSNFIFHDSQGFECGSNEEMVAVREFLQRRSTSTELKDQLHAIWYCIPMDSPRPLLSAELEFFNTGTGQVPLLAVFTKFDGRIIIEYMDLENEINIEYRWNKARENAYNTFQQVYLPKVFETKYPPKAYTRLEDMDLPEGNCPDLVEKTANAIDDKSLHQLLVSTQMNNLNLCVEAALKYVLTQDEPLWRKVVIMVLSKFPHFWADRRDVSIMVHLTSD